MNISSSGQMMPNLSCFVQHFPDLSIKQADFELKLEICPFSWVNLNSKFVTIIIWERKKENEQTSFALQKDFSDATPIVLN